MLDLTIDKGLGKLGRALVRLYKTVQRQELIPEVRSENLVLKSVWGNLVLFGGQEARAKNKSQRRNHTGLPDSPPPKTVFSCHPQPC
jgi:hypothetical protein